MCQPTKLFFFDESIFDLCVGMRSALVWLQSDVKLRPALCPKVWPGSWARPWPSESRQETRIKLVLNCHRGSAPYSNSVTSPSDNQLFGWSVGLGWYLKICLNKVSVVNVASCPYFLEQLSTCLIYCCYAVMWQILSDESQLGKCMNWILLQSMQRLDSSGHFHVFSLHCWT